jgi:hypothetical protein
MTMTNERNEAMITMHCTYPDGATSEARYGLSMYSAIRMYEQFDWPDWPIYERTLCTKSMDQANTEYGLAQLPGGTMAIGGHLF